MNPLNQKQLISYLKLRAAIGLVGILFPVVLLIFGNFFGNCDQVQESLSAYYFTNARDFFVGLLFITGTLLLTYRGYDNKDSILANISGASAIGIALCPTHMGDRSDACSLSSTYDLPVLHYIFAGTFFLTLILFSMVIFTKTDPTKEPTPEKLKRNRVYRICGWIMIISLALMAVNKFLTKEISSFLGLQSVFTFVMEWIFLSAFGVSWITKGEYILSDK
jgi:hypothetical protein